MLRIGTTELERVRSLQRLYTAARLDAAAVPAAALLATALLAGRAHGGTVVEVEFVPMTPAHGAAARAYEAIWDEHGEHIVAALEAKTCMPFTEAKISAVVADAPSHSGGPEHPMRLRASYSSDVKRSTLVHELGHRHLWQLVERLEYLDGHRTLYLVLDRVWAEVWGEAFARERIGTESGWNAEYDYASAWDWALSLPTVERDRLWARLLDMNGFSADCRAPRLSTARSPT